MKALVYERPTMMKIKDVPLPVPGTGEVLIRVGCAGICGSELSGYMGHSSIRRPPLIMGHEFAGTVDQIGVGVTGVRPGDRVVVNPLLTCGRCSNCAGGEEQRCASRQLLGAHLSGAFAEFVTVPAQNCYPIPDILSFAEAALAEPLACAIHICRLLRVSAEERLLIIGAGPIGLFALQASQYFGLRHVAIMDINRERLQIAKQLGASPVHSDQELAAVKPASGFDVAIDAVGMTSTRAACMEAVRIGGRVGFTGLHEAESTLPVNGAIRGELTMFGAFAYSRADFEMAIQWTKEYSAVMMPWTEMFSLDQGKVCFDKLLAGAGAIVKILLVPDGN
ncbi:zinc-dependent alcohol dehydrogenase [Paenibacillus sp. GYB003]|uniref:zinc-dependent alcohol dehydrogenase n=1 Tax=Paenibacillus sp. GYB003 TaxID=2994392 RepID=UPI002F9673B6